MKTLILLIALLASGAIDAASAPADPDPSFGAAGTTRLGFGAGDDFGYAMMSGGGGTYLVAGSSIDGLRRDAVVIRYLSNGAPDPAFGVQGIGRLSSGPQSSAAASVITMLADGRILIGGVDGSNLIVGRLLSNGTPDPSFGTNGIVTVPSGSFRTISGIATQGTKILLAGSAIVGGIYHFAVVRLNEDGSFDTSFDGDGIVRIPILVESFANAMLIQPDGKIVLTGYARDSSQHRALAVARLSTSGVPDATFDGDGITYIYAGSGDSYGYALAFQSVSNKLIVAGDYGPAAGPRNALIIRYNSNGSLDPTFGPAAGTGIIIQPIGAGDDTFRSLTIQFSGVVPSRIIAAGATRSSNSGNISDVAVCRYLLTGALDTAFDGDGILITSTSPADDRANAAMIAGSRLVIAGYSGFGGSAPDLLLIAYQTSNGALDATLDGDGIMRHDIGNATSGAAAMVTQADGKIVLAGSTDTSPPSIAMARLQPDGSLDPAFSGDGRTLVTFGSGTLGQCVAHDALIQPEGAIVVVGSTGPSPSYQLGVARLLSNGALDPSFAVGGLWRSSGNEEGWGGALQADGAIVTAGNSPGSTPALRVRRLTSGGAVDNSFGTSGVFDTKAGGALAYGRDLLVEPGGGIVVVGFAYPTVGSSSQLLLLRLTTSGALDPNFGTGGVTLVDVGPLSDAALSVARQPDGALVVCGLVTQSSSASDACVLRFDATGHLDPSFSGDGIYIRPGGGTSDRFSAVTSQADGRILLAGTSTQSFSFASDQLIMRLLPDGSPDPTFGDNGVRLADSGSQGDAATAVAVLPDGRILVAGITGYLMSVSRLEGGPAASAVPEPADRGPLSFVGLPWPNPTARGISIECQSAAAGNVEASAEVFDAAGRLVRRLGPSSLETGGRRRITWDASGADGSRVRAGVYFVRVRVADHVEARRVVVR